MRSVFVFAIWCLSACSAEFADEMHVYEQKCLGEDAYQCLNGDCVLNSQYCDGNLDCTDGSDENFCPHHIVNEEFCHDTDQYICHDRAKCIPRTWVCNNETECDDGSDEVNCTNIVEPIKNSTCKGFKCGDGKCISTLWICDGTYDCQDKSDEDVDRVCRHSLVPQSVRDGRYCYEFPGIGPRNYVCLDKSLCLPDGYMCDGLQDCRDGSDEGPFCNNWHMQCDNHVCGNESCTPDREGPACTCKTLSKFNPTTRLCEDLNECEDARPTCSHSCHNKNGYFVCTCDDGYIRDTFGYLCYATGPAPLLFFSTSNDIRYISMKSEQEVTVVSGIKQAHGVTYDGKYLYWVETAQDHQSIFRAQFEDIQETKTVLVGLGLEDPGDIALDYLGGHIYFGDAMRGVISACRTDGSMCTTIRTDTRHPKFVSLDVRNGAMYWADYKESGPVIMTARMDGSEPAVVVPTSDPPTGVTVDAANGRLYFVDKTIQVVKLDDKQQYPLFEEQFHHPYTITVFENTVYWSDRTSRTIQTCDKLHSSGQKRSILATLNTPVYGLHMYHPLMMNAKSNPCQMNKCSHFCFVTSNETHACGCPDGMELIESTCQYMPSYRPQYLIVGAGSLLTRIQYDTIGNPESHITDMDIGRVQAMAYDSFRDTLYLYDGQRKTVNYLNMSDFTLGITHYLLHDGLENVVDMDYDYATDTLYVLDAGRRILEAVSLRTQLRALVYRFKDQEMPISFCIVPEYGKMLVAVQDLEGGSPYRIHIDGLTLNGERRDEIVTNDLKGPHIKLRYSQTMENVYLADEGNGAIEYIHPSGSGRENYRELLTTITGLAVTNTYVFWTDRKTPRLFWSDIQETMPRARRIELSMFPNATQLHILATSPYPEAKEYLLTHPCLTKNPCVAVCVQNPHIPPGPLTFKCLCPPGLLLLNGQCQRLKICNHDEFYCHQSNDCFSKSKLCDGKQDCQFGEDEHGCKEPSQTERAPTCPPGHIDCSDKCIAGSSCDDTSESFPSCDISQFTCIQDGFCIERSQMCDGRRDCEDGSDEDKASCETAACLDSEFMCTSGSCILDSFTCDGERDCLDGSDEAFCKNRTCPAGYFHCKNDECLELRKRCDGQQDCFDFSDEDGCNDTDVVGVTDITPKCAPWEHQCELNKSICVPITAKCNLKIDCPGGTDEEGCDIRCGRLGLFNCKQQHECLSMSRACDGVEDCLDGSDETPEVCYRVNRTSRIYTPFSDCKNGFLCRNGQCIEWREVCNNVSNCIDGSDESRSFCASSCNNSPCTYKCLPTPRGPQCLCPLGFELQANMTCTDIDECATEVCSQNCHNRPGSFLCSCHHGYALRSDRRSCKAVRGHMSILYVSGNSVRSITASGKGAVEYHDPKVASISDLDFNVRANKLYVTSAQANKLVEVNSTQDDVVITNVGTPTRVSVDWVTGNVYFVDSSSTPCIRVCHVKHRRCAKLQKLPSGAEVSALAVDPSSRRMFYCVTRELESVVWSASLAGSHVTDLTTVHNCTGLAVDSFRNRLYVAETGPMHIIRMDLDGERRKTILTNDPHLEAPHGLAIFEDHIYFLVANSFKLSRCLLFGSKRCDAYLYRIFDANTFVVRHESVQRDDLKDPCEGFVCSNVCAMDAGGPRCVCEDGSFAANGECHVVDQSLTPQFEGWSGEGVAAANQASYSLITGVLVMFALYLCVFAYWQFVYRKRNARPEPYVEFQNSPEGYVTTSPSSNADFNPQTSSTNIHEFANPLNLVQHLWRKSFHRQRPVQCTSNTIFEAPTPEEDVSDTESDLDFKDTKRIISKNPYF